VIATGFKQVRQRISLFFLKYNAGAQKRRNILKRDARNRL